MYLNYGKCIEGKALFTVAQTWIIYRDNKNILKEERNE